MGGAKVFAADHSAQFKSLSQADAKAPRNPDGSLPENDFCRLVSGSIFVDKGEITEGFEPVRFMTQAEAAQYGLELAQAAPVTIEHNGAAPDLGAFESGVPSAGRLYLVSGEVEQTVYAGTEIEPVVMRWGGAATDVAVEGAGSLTLTRDTEAKTLTINGVPTGNVNATVTTVGGETEARISLTVTVSDVAPATLVCTTGNASQTLFYDTPVQPITFEAGGGATGIEVEGLPEGLEYSIEGKTLTITGIPEAEGRYTVTATGGMKPVSLSGTIALETAYRILTGGWYDIQDPFDALPADLQGVVDIESSETYPTVWNPEYTESGSVPGGCTKGAVNVERGGALVWRLPSLLELKANVHFTGGRYLEVRWQYEGEAERSWTSDKLKKATLAGWDLMAAAGITETDRPVTVKFVNPTSNNGGIRVYDFFVKIHDDGQSGIGSVALPGADAGLGYYVTDGAIVIGTPAKVAGAALYALDGRMVASSRMSSILPRPSGRPGVYLLQVIAADGTSHVAKVVLR